MVPRQEYPKSYSLLNHSRVQLVPPFLSLPELSRVSFITSKHPIDTSMSTSTFGIALLLLCSSQAFGQQCYFTDGSAALDDLPCRDNATESNPSMCCGPGAFCLSNGLCTDGLYLSRGSCTDHSFGSPNCAQICTQCKPSTVEDQRYDSFADTI